EARGPRRHSRGCCPTRAGSRCAPSDWLRSRPLPRRHCRIQRALLRIPEISRCSPRYSTCPATMPVRGRRESRLVCSPQGVLSEGGVRLSLQLVCPGQGGPSAVGPGRVWLYDEELPAVLTPEDEVYLRDLPEFLAITIDGLGLMLTHYGYPDLVGDSTTFDPLNSENLARHLHFIEEHGCSIGLSGHDGWNGMVVARATETREV